MKRILHSRWLLVFLIPVILGWAWRGVDWEQVAGVLQNLQGWSILLWVGVNAGVILAFSLRWWLILSAFGYNAPYLKLAGYRLAGFAVSFLTPGPQFGGEPLQVYALNRKEKIPLSDSLASVVLDKSLELVSNLAFLGFGILIILWNGLIPQGLSLKPELKLVGLAGLSLAALLPLGYLGLLWSGKQPLTRSIKAIARLRIVGQNSNRWVETTRSAEEQAADFFRCKPVWFGVILAQSLAVWGLVIFDVWLSYRLLGLNLAIPQVVFTLVAARLALLLPAPGGLGTLEASQVMAAQFLQVDPAFAVGVTLLARSRDLLLVGIGAALAVWITYAGKVKFIPVQTKVLEFSFQEVEHETGD